jgi:hypothetical protein
MKTMLILIIAEIFLLSISPSAAFSSEKIVNPISFTGCTKVQFPETDKRPSFILEVYNDRKIEDAWPEDHFILRLSDPLNNKTITETHFSSSYGYFNLKIFDITGEGIEDFILIQGNGRGTSARSESILVFQHSGQTLKKILDEPISDYYGLGYQWKYKLKILTIDSDKVVLRLILDSIPVDKECDLCEPSLIPEEKIREFVFDKNTETMVRYTESGRVNNPTSY